MDMDSKFQKLVAAIKAALAQCYCILKAELRDLQPITPS